MRGDPASHVAIRVLLAIVVAIAVQVIAHQSIGDVVRRVVRSHRFPTRAEEKKRENTLIQVFRPVSAVLIWAVAVIVILSDLHVNLAALLTGAGLAGVLIGIGAQSALKDYLAGAFIILENQFRVGDIVTLNATGGNIVSGVVEDISIRITKLRDLDGNLNLVRNGDVLVITNRTMRYSNVNVDVIVGYEADVDKVEKTINEIGTAMAEDESWQEIIQRPIQFLRVDSFGTSGVTVKALGRVEPAKQWDVAGEFRRRLFMEFKKKNIEFGLPQRVVHQPKGGGK